MDEASKTSRPEGISLAEAYSAIRETFRANVGKLEGRDDEYSLISGELVRLLPEPSAATELGMRAVMQEVISGRLEWGYSLDDGRHTMADYAKAAVEPYGDWQMAIEELRTLRSTRSPLWPYLTPGIAAYRVVQAQRQLERGDGREAEETLQRGLQEARERQDAIGEIEVQLALADTLSRTGREKGAIPLMEVATVRWTQYFRQVRG